MGFFEGVLGGLGSWLGGQGEEGGLETVSTLDPWQAKIRSRLGDFIYGRIGQPAPSFEKSAVQPFDFTKGSQWVAPATEYEQTGLNRLSEYLNQTQLPDIYQTGQNALSSLIQQGTTPQNTIDWYNQYIKPEEQRVLEQQILPGVRESYAGSGNYMGSPRMLAEAQAQQTYGTQQLQRVGQAIQNAQQMAAGLTPQALSYSQYAEQFPLRQTAASQQYGGLERQLKQADLMAQFEEFKRISPELSPLLDKALQFLGIQTQAMYNRPFEQSGWANILSGVIGGIQGGTNPFQRLFGGGTAGTGGGAAGIGGGAAGLGIL